MCVLTDHSCISPFLSNVLFLSALEFIFLHLKNYPNGDATLPAMLSNKWEVWRQIDHGNDSHSPPVMAKRE